MSRFVTKTDEGYIEEIESIEVCKYRINYTCCCKDSEYLGWDMPRCDNKEICANFLEEDGVIERRNK
jgi:hypothetical protein